MGQTLVGKVFSTVEPKAGNAADLIDHISAAWHPLDADVRVLRRDKAWTRYVDNGEHNEKYAFALIKAIVVVFVAADNGAAVGREPLRREYCANFTDYFRSDPASKDGRTNPSGTDLKPDIYIRKILSASTTKPPKYW